MVTLRPLLEHECPAASALCMRSKARWGYDRAFLAACRGELTIRADDLARCPTVVAMTDRDMAGVAQVSAAPSGCFLEKLFVAPERMGEGIGRRLFLWASDCAESLGARTLVVEADPGAVPFYERMGCIRTGSVPSGSIPGRRIPVLVRRLSALRPSAPVPPAPSG